MIIKRIKNMMLTVLLIGLFSISVSAAGENTSYNDAVSNMLSMGFSQQYINDLNEEEILKYKNATLYSSDEKYVKIISSENGSKVIESSENEWLMQQKATENNVKVANIASNAEVANIAGNDDPAVTTTSWLKLETSILHNSGNSYFMSCRYEWLKDPTYNLEDVLGMGCSGADVLYNTFTFVQKYDITCNHASNTNPKYSNGTSTITVNDNTPSKYTTNGIAKKFNLPIKYDVHYGNEYPRPYSYQDYTSNIRGYMRVDLYKNNTNNTIISNIATYDHQQFALSFSPSIEFDLKGAMSLTGAFSFSSTYDQVIAGKNRVLP